MKKILFITVGIIATIILILYIQNRVYRLMTIDKGLGKMIKNGAIILDVRTEKEFGRGNIDGSINISSKVIKERYKKLDTSKTYITYCSHGLRSVDVEKILKEKGFKKVFNGGALSDLKKIIEMTNQKK